MIKTRRRKNRDCPHSQTNRGLSHLSEGFTLIELLITSFILGVISVGIIASFASGLKVYEKVQNYMGSRADVLLALERIERDLRNIVNSSVIEFIGENELISFASVTDDGSLGRVLYYVKGARDMFTREEQGYKLATAMKLRKGKGKVKKLVSVRDIDFTFYYYDKEDKEYKWVELWDPEENGDEGEEISEDERVPLGVRLELTFIEGRERITLTRTVLVPVGYRGPVIEEG